MLQSNSCDYDILELHGWLNSITKNYCKMLAFWVKCAPLVKMKYGIVFKYALLNINNNQKWCRWLKYESRIKLALKWDKTDRIQLIMEDKKWLKE